MRLYSDYLRWRMVYKKVILPNEPEEIASQLFVCPKLFTGRLMPFGIPVM